MLFILILFLLPIVWLFIEFVFWFTHKRPLTDFEIKKLMIKRRSKYIKKYFSLRETNTFPDKRFKSGLKPSGRFYATNINSICFPSYVANLLKGKKHEWVVLACLKDNFVKCFYANKGDDNKSVAFNVNINEVINMCRSNGYQTIMRFHNHPNNDPRHYTNLLASEQDRRSANHLSKIAVSQGVNWLDYVCERGHVLEFARLFCNHYYPAECGYVYISNQNSRRENYYRLQRELGIFR